MVSPRDKGWGDPGDPGSDADRRYRRDHLTWLETGGIRLLVRKEVAPLFDRFIRELTGPRYNYRLNGSADDWGYANRYVRGSTTVKSNHSWGLAIDLNAATNPMTNDGLCHTDMPPGISKLAAKYGLRWGGDYSRRKDPMHFEFTGTPADAQEYVRHTSALSDADQTSMEKTMAKLDAEDLGNIKKIVDKETNDIYWRILGVPEGTPNDRRPNLTQILNAILDKE